MSYAETAEKVFEYGPHSTRRLSGIVRRLVDNVLIVSGIAGGCVFIVFVGNTFHGLCSNLIGWNYSVRTYIFITVIPIVFMGQVKKLKNLIYFSLIGNAFIMATFGIVMFYIFQEPLVFKDKPLIIPWTRWRIFFR